MRVQDIMTKSPTFCNPTTNLATVTSLLWSAGCGALPVVDGTGRVVGMITDRDVCIALGTRNRRAADLVVAQVMSGRLFVCRPTDDIHAALKTMRIRKVRRLPVINHEGKLEGLLTMSEIILQAFHDDGRAKRPDVSYEDVMGTLIGIHLHHIRAVASCGEQVPHRSHAA